MKADIERLLKSTGLTLSQTQLDQCEEYLLLMDKWNRVYNLTSINDPTERIIKHLADSLSAVPYIKDNRIIDVGSGAGLPGIPLAIYYPDYSFDLLDSNIKKTNFLQQCRRVLSLSNLNIIHARVEDYQPRQLFDTVICRAFSDLADIVSKTQHLCCNNGKIIAMKGRFPEEELEQLTQQGWAYQVHTVLVPGLKAERHIVEIRVMGDSGG